jgi:hypothetical protein
LPGDPSIIRHLHDLAALAERATLSRRFPELVLAAAEADAGRGGGAPAGDPATMFAEMLQRLETDPLWAREYEDFVRQVSFAGPGEVIDFAAALAACTQLIAVAMQFSRGTKKMMDRSPAAVSRHMALIRKRDTKPELLVRRLCGAKFRLYQGSCIVLHNLVTACDFRASSEEGAEPGS